MSTEIKRDSSAQQDQVKVAVIYGSTREGRLCDTVVNWTAEQISERGQFSIDLIDPLKFARGFSGASQTEMGEVRRRIGEADAFVVVTPEYNHGYPAPLKELIDAIGAEWQAKPVAFVSYGGVSGGLRAVEQLRQVFAELHAMTIRDSVSLAFVHRRFDESGRMLEPERPLATMATMLARLHWWAVALRIARTASPYSEVAIGA